MADHRFALRSHIAALLVTLASLMVLGRIGLAAADLAAGKADGFLAIPLCVILPYLAFLYLARLPGTLSSEGAVMRLAAMVLVLLILGIPSFALHLALGFPVAFLVVELFETRLPRNLRDRIKHWVIA